MAIIGVAGHRILMEPDKIEAGINAAISRIEEAFPGQPLIIFSPLAEGADRQVACQVLSRPGGRLVAVLPLEKDDYLQDFATQESKQEFLELLDRADKVVQMKPDASRDLAYEAAGGYVLDHCEVLIAVWDGLGAQGQRGTGGIVAEARKRKMPIAWVHAGNRKPGTGEATTLGRKQGKVTLENLPL